MGWLNSANTGKGAAASYQQVSVPTTASVIPGYSTASVAGQSQIAAQGATVDINDSVMTNNCRLPDYPGESVLKTNRHRQS